MAIHDTQLKAGVIGAGVFGGHHARKYAGSGRAQLIGVFDVNAERAGALAQELGTQAYTDMSALIEACDAVTVASPAMAHYDGVKAALSAGRHVLVEKPLADTAARGEELISIARSRDLVLQVGHQERFVFNAMGVFDIKDAPRRIAARRMGLRSARNLDVSVTVDLMIHDLDLVMALAQAPMTGLEASARKIFTDLPDAAEAQLTFADSFEAHLESSRAAEALDRVMRIDFDSGFLEVDFVAKTFINETGYDLNPDFADDPKAKDSLGANVNAFIESVLDGTPVAVPAEAGLAALAVAREIDRAAGV
ncbi:Gfo/Idh/MocA family oxidoreductase [Hyphobacterium sp. HN65]|uniref:Gfo/Idh/MocA family oxidoreductase n=1 Tax=Hyphobacterium lacteum TaxID=3116575 RepID=A0ABU7LT51_9PROT|nr:Gfo/Idh/MocA family oxidoreductase [Hyphobacterium sp. HN65]MEE2527103.1 Gfo/Idh/MocA family oxidoreductase [Hyphobacterium sp. HN65]